MVIHKTDKGNPIVIVDREKYIKKMKKILSDQRKFQKTTVKYDQFLNFITSQEKRINRICKKFVDWKILSK